MINMSKEEFLLALNKEGLLIYGTTWLENFKRLQEIVKKYITIQVEAQHNEQMIDNIMEIQKFINSANGNGIEKFHGYITVKGVSSKEGE